MKNLCREAGYEGLFAILPELAFTDPQEFVTGRVGVNPSDWALEFRLKILGAYRWLPIVFSWKRKLFGSQFQERSQASNVKMRNQVRPKWHLLKPESVTRFWQRFDHAGRNLPTRAVMSAVASSPVPAKIREAQFSDYQAITDLKQRFGLVPDSLEKWKHLWQYNPALKPLQTKRPIGWVVEAEGKIVGYLGSIPSLYRFGEKTLTAVIGSGFVAEPAYRAHTVRLMGAFYAQKPVDLYISTTAVEATGKIACAFGCEPMPQGDYETVMFWVLRPYPFIQTVMKKLQIKPALSKVLGCCGFGRTGDGEAVPRTLAAIVANESFRDRNRGERDRRGFRSSVG